MIQPPREVRRKDREISAAEAAELLARGEYGVLSTVGPDGLPYGVPLNYAFRDGQIYFHSAPEGRKVDHLISNALASFCVVGATEVLPAKFSTRYESAIAAGEIRELSGEEKRAALGHLTDKYSPEFPAEAAAYIAHSESKTRVFALTVRHLTGKRRR